MRRKGVGSKRSEKKGQRSVSSLKSSVKEKQTIGIVGLGLMGGSLAAACRRHFPASRIIGISRSPLAVREAVSKKWIHAGGSDLKNLIPACDLIVLCTPVDTLKPLLKKIDSFAKPGAVVTDVGSVKGEICNWAAKQRFMSVSFVGAHPMAGSHNRGIEAASPQLYEGQLTFLIKAKGTAYENVKSFWSKISGRVIEINAALHDKITAEISHLPHAVAACLVRSASPRTLPFAAKGFLDSTRIAQADSSVWVPIFLANRPEVLKALSGFEKNIKTFKKALSAGQSLQMEAFLKRTSRIRQSILL